MKEIDFIAIDSTDWLFCSVVQKGHECHPQSFLQVWKRCRQPLFSPKILLVRFHFDKIWCAHKIIWSYASRQIMCESICHSVASVSTTRAWNTNTPPVQYVLCQLCTRCSRCFDVAVGLWYLRRAGLTAMFCFLGYRELWREIWEQE